ncbi:MAG: phage holin family protein [Candidatus Pacebacteria bacterium]|jgi:putative membrane protein|nr:phage holin family protein [Candidatus Paceibacterota bacterium]
MKFILKWLIVALSVLGAAYVVPGIDVDSFYIALIVALVWGLVSFFIKPILQILALPITILTLGLFSLVINGLLFWFVASFIEGFHVDGFFAAVLGALAVAILSWIGGKILIRDK